MKKAVFQLPTGELKYFDLDFLLKEGKSLTLQEREIGGKLSYFSEDRPAETEKFTHAEFRKPPLGVTPRGIHDRIRFEALDRAMNEYILQHKTIPTEWLEEWNELYKKIKGIK